MKTYEKQWKIELGNSWLFDTFQNVACRKNEFSKKGEHAKTIIILQWNGGPAVCGETKSVQKKYMFCFRKKPIEQTWKRDKRGMETEMTIHPKTDEQW